jgi:DNA-binding IscR family transcriptional regulator
MNHIRNRGLIEFQRGSGHGAKLQKLPPARGISHWFVLSNTQEDLAPVHPVKKQPVEQQDGSAQKQRLQARTKNEKRRVSQVGEEITVKKIFPQVGNEIGGNGIGAHDDEEKGPAPILLDVNDPAERG